MLKKQSIAPELSHPKGLFKMESSFPPSQLWKKKKSQPNHHNPTAIKRIIKEGGQLQYLCL